MKHRFFFLICIALSVYSLSAAEFEWEWDAKKADSLFYSGDYDSAWLFYERAINSGADDAKVLFRAAESFNSQQIVENPEFGSALYDVSAYLMEDQYPGDAALPLAQAKANPEVSVTRRYIRKTFGMIGAKAPRTRRQTWSRFGSDFGTGIGSNAIAFGTAKIEDLGTFCSVLFSEGIRAAMDWGKGRLWSLFLGYLIISLIPGILLPVVMAVTVAREGRKSYVSAYFFLLFWGPLGIHRFYLGRHISGIVWLLTGGLAGLGLFFDLFLTGAYIRFWNEDHREERPSGVGLSVGGGVSRRAKNPRPPKSRKPKKVKNSRVKTSKPLKPKKDKKPPKAKVVETVLPVSALPAAGEALTDEGFSFDTPSGEEDFGDISDLDIGGDDFNIPSLGEGDGGNDEFDLEALE